MVSETSLPHSEKLATCSYPEILSLTKSEVFPNGSKYDKFICGVDIRTSSNHKLKDIPLIGRPRPLSQYVRSIHVTVPPSPIWRRAMQCWQAPTYHGRFNVINSVIRIFRTDVYINVKTQNLHKFVLWPMLKSIKYIWGVEILSLLPTIKNFVQCGFVISDLISANNLPV